MSGAGDTQFAGVQHGSWMQAWRRFGWLPELFDIAISTRHPLEKVPAVVGEQCPRCAVTLVCCAHMPKWALAGRCAKELWDAAMARSTCCGRKLAQSN